MTLSTNFSCKITKNLPQEQQSRKNLLLIPNNNANFAHKTKQIWQKSIQSKY